MTTRCLLLILGLIVPLASGTASAQDFGAGIQLQEETPLATVIAKAETLGVTPVLVRGTVTDVCQRKGCWTVIRDGSEHVRVRFKDYGFFVPTDCAGREALVEGTVTVKTLSADMARHYEEETKGGDPNAVTGPRREVSMTASGVRLLPDEPKSSVAPAG